MVPRIPSAPGRRHFDGAVVGGVDQTVGPGVLSGLAPVTNAPGGAVRAAGRRPDISYPAPRQRADVARRVDALDRLARFSRAIKLAEEPASWLRPMMNTPAMLSSPVARIVMAIIVSISQKPSSSPPTVDSGLVAMTYSTHSLPFHRHA